MHNMMGVRIYLESIKKKWFRGFLKIIRRQINDGFKGGGEENFQNHYNCQSIKVTPKNWESGWMRILKKFLKNLLIYNIGKF